MRKPSGEFHALDGVSFEVAEGDVVGVIGRNGAGKSTLLKILSRITEPTRGRVTFRGRVGSLLEVGTGFHPELTGRENIFLNGAILGMCRHEIARKFDAIVAFSEIADFLDTPVKRYSSGMYVRLAFAVASHLEPEILIVDEVLAVGDQAFQKKCLGRMAEIGRSGRTVLFVSHSMPAILNLCRKGILLERGSLAHYGSSREVVERYMSSISSDFFGHVDMTSHPNRRKGSTSIMKYVTLKNIDDNISDKFKYNNEISIELGVDTRGLHSGLHLGIAVEDALGCRVCTLATTQAEGPLELSGGLQKFTCKWESPNLAPGRYSLSFYCGYQNQIALDAIEQSAWIDVEDDDIFGTGLPYDPSWGPLVAASRWNCVDGVR